MLILIMIGFNNCKTGSQENNFQSSHQSTSKFQKLKLSFFLFNQGLILLTRAQKDALIALSPSLLSVIKSMRSIRWYGRDWIRLWNNSLCLLLLLWSKLTQQSLTGHLKRMKGQWCNVIILNKYDRGQRIWGQQVFSTDLNTKSLQKIRWSFRKSHATWLKICHKLHIYNSNVTLTTV